MMSDDPEVVLSKFEDSIETSIKKLGDYIQREIWSRVTENAKNEMLPIIEEGIRKAFNEAVTAFYTDGFEPKYYRRKADIGAQQGGLFDILEIHKGKESGALESYEFSSNKFTDVRTPAARESIFETVFEEGWHGGAKSGSKNPIWGMHPNPGIPYYRRPGIVHDVNTGIRYRHKFARWGKKAEHGSSPEDAAIDNIQTAADGEWTDLFTEKLRDGMQENTDLIAEKWLEFLGVNS